MSDYKTYEVKVWADGSKQWFLNGKRHREDGPAIEWADGSKEWWLHGKCHREDGPALEYANGAKEWFLHGLHHREDGPAIEWTGGDKWWFLHGEELTEEEHRQRTAKYPCNGKIVEIDGIKYKLTEV